MFIGIAAALLAGVMLGLYALPGKYTTDFEEENKWSLFFVLTMFVVPLVATFTLMKRVGAVYSEIDSTILVIMIVSSFLWGGVVMTFYFLFQLSQKKAWGKFKTPSFGKNFGLIFVMAFFHYAASAIYAFAAAHLHTASVA